jgi:lipopolysaccharide biosynthesis protein
MKNSPSVRPIAIYLPQFHPTPENDEWWGKGFTEWTNVTKAEPLYTGHYQPRLPADLGFCDLRVPETREAQVQLAKEYGIQGFCYYHYWFNGKRILQRPIDEILASKQPDFPFMLCWANETWSRRWLGEEKEVLISQTYSEKDDVNHINWLYDTVFGDERYIKVHGRPAFIIYRPHDLPDHQKTLALFKQIARERDQPEPFMIGSNSHGDDYLTGFDHVLNFEPQLGLLPDAFADGPSTTKQQRNKKFNIKSAELKVYDYGEVKRIMAERKFGYKYLPCVFVGWDNTARRGKNGIIIHGQNTADFKQSLLRAKEMVQEYPADEQLVFINAWNEWAEGNHLEPCTAYGRTFLDTVKEVFHD